MLMFEHFRGELFGTSQKLAGLARLSLARMTSAVLTHSGPMNTMVSLPSRTGLPSRMRRVIFWTSRSMFCCWIGMRDKRALVNPLQQTIGRFEIRGCSFRLATRLRGKRLSKGCLELKLVKLKVTFLPSSKARFEAVNL